MNKEFVPYEQALALKELGFDKPCFKYYSTEISRPEETLFETRGGYEPEDSEIPAPLLQQAFRWFREKYGLHRHICYFNDTNVWHGDIYKIQNEGLMNNPMELTNYKTYEEAELECLKKLIEIVKNK